MPSEDTLEDESSQKPSKKKRTRLKRQKAVNGNFNNTDEPPKPIERINSLKLFGVAKIPKPQQKSKTETKKKFRRTSLVATATVHIAKMKTGKTVLEPFSDFSSSEDLLATTRPRINKKKKKIGSVKNRASSANVLLRNMKNDNK